MAERGRGRGGGGGDRGGRGGRGGNLPFHPRGGPSSQGDRGRGGGGGGGGGGRGDRGGGFRGGDRGGGFRGGDRGRGDRGGSRGGDRGGRGGGGFRGGGGGGGGAGMRGGDSGDRPPFRVDAELFTQGQAPAIDVSVQKTEDAVVKSTQTYLAGKPKTLEPVHPPRPSYGTKGQPVTLWANYFRMNVPSELALYRYSVDMKLRNGTGTEPKIGPKRKKEIIEQLLDEKLMAHKPYVATDFSANLVSSKHLGAEFENFDYAHTYRRIGSDALAAGDARAKVYSIRIQAQGTLTVSQLLNYLNQTRVQDWKDEQQQIISALNIILGHHPKSLSNVSSTSASKHFNTAAAAHDRLNVGSGIEAIRGYFVSVRPATGRLLFNIQVKNGAFYQPVPLNRLMKMYAAQPGQHIVSLAKFLKRLNINATHMKNKNAAGQEIPGIRTIIDVARPTDGSKAGTRPRVARYGAGPQDVQFFLQKNRDGPADSTDKWISVAEFFKQQFNIATDNSLPVVNVGSSEKPVYLPAEVCMILPGQQVRAKLDPNQTANMIGFAVRRPHQNAQSIVSTGVQLLGLEQGNHNPKVTAFGINVQPRMIAVPGRVLPVPSLTYAGNKKTTPRFGSWNLSSSKLVHGSRLDSWAWIRIRRTTDGVLLSEPEHVDAEMAAFSATLNASGVMAPKCLGGMMLNVTENDYAKQIDEMVRKMSTSKDRKVQFLIVVLPEKNNTQLYNQVKISCDINHGVLNLCVQDKKFAKRSVDTYANIALKVNLKLGGGNHYCDPTKLGIIKDGKTMVVGLDVTHPSPGSKDAAPSVAAIVASVNSHLSQWPAAIGILPARQEMIKEGMQELFKTRLALWKERNNAALPENIIIYRDGVSEGQYDLVLNTELPEIRKACSEVYKPDQTKAGLPKISIIVVGKRHHTRFYAAQDGKADRSGNPNNGTVVDRGVTQAWLWDFFLQAHTAIQGTARPAHYYVIYDQIFRPRQTASALAADALEEMTHSMCYMFGRATKAVSICPPAYYADLVAERARCYMHQFFEPSASDTASTSGASSQQGGGATQNLVRLHQNVANKMFYT